MLAPRGMAMARELVQVQVLAGLATQWQRKTRWQRKPQRRGQGRLMDSRSRYSLWLYRSRRLCSFLSPKPLGSHFQRAT